MVNFTTTTLVEAIERTAHVPQGNNTFDFDGFLAIADTEMRTRIAPHISSCRENYWLTTKTYEANESNAYAIPSKALGGSFVTVKINVSGQLIPLSRVEVSELYSLQFTTRPSYTFYLEDNLIKCLSVVNLGPVMVWYYRIPSKLVAVDECGQITAIDYDAGEVTVDAVPATFVGQELDVVSQNPGFNVLIKDNEPTSIAGSVITFDEVPDSVQIGDYVCLSGQSCVVQAPLEWIEVLVQAAAVRIYQIQGYLGKHKVALEDLAKMEKGALGLVSPRSIESPKIISGGGSLLYPQVRGWKMPVRGS